MIKHRKKHQTDDPKTWPSKEVMAGERDRILKIAYGAGLVMDQVGPTLGRLNKELFEATTHRGRTTSQDFLDGHANRRNVLDRLGPSEERYEKAKRLRQSSFVRANILARRIGAVEVRDAELLKDEVDKEDVPMDTPYILMKPYEGPKP